MCESAEMRVSTVITHLLCCMRMDHDRSCSETLSRFVAYGMGRLHRQDAPCATSHTLHRYATWYVAAFPDQHAVWSAPMFLAPRRAVPGATREHHETTPPGVALLLPLPDLITVIP